MGPSKTSKSTGPDIGAAPSALDQSDDQVLATIRASSSALTFTRLFAGNWASHYPSQSEADLALAGILATHCGANVEQIDRLFRTSGLYRDKWDEQRREKTYGEKTIAKALEEKIEHNDREATNDDDQGSQGTRAQALAKFNEPPVFGGKNGGKGKVEGCLTDCSHAKRESSILAARATVGWPLLSNSVMRG